MLKNISILGGKGKTHQSDKRRQRLQLNNCYNCKKCEKCYSRQHIT